MTDTATVRGGIADILPLTPLQEGLLFHGQYADGGPAPYVNQVVVDLDGDVGGGWNAEPGPLAPLRDGVAELLRRHPHLRAGFRYTSTGRGVAVVPHPGEPPWSNHDLLDEADPEAAADRIAAEERERGFDLARPPLIRVAGLRLTATRCRLVITKHHILWDGWSLQVVLRELLGYAAGRTLPAPPRYADYLRWLAGRDRAAAERAWAGALSGLAEPTVLAAPGTGTSASAASVSLSEEPTVVSRRLSVADTERLTGAARRLGVTTSTLVQLAWGVLLGSLTGRDDVVFGSTVSGRPAELPGVADIVGLLINTVPVRVRLRPTEPVARAVTRLQDELAELLDHQHLGLSEVQRIGGLGPLFDSLVVYENYPHDPAAIAGSTPEDRARGGPGGLALSIADYRGDEATHYPLVLVAMPGERLELRVKYRPAALPAAFPVATLADRLVTVLDRMVAAPSRAVGALDVLPGDERRMIVEDWNDTATEVPYRSLVERFEECAARDPGATALVDAVDGAGEWSYGRLNARANRLARRLRAAGVDLEHTVGVHLPRSPELVLAMLAVLKAGGAFVPLDRAWPARRAAEMSAALTAVITDDPAAFADVLVVPFADALTDSDGPDPDAGRRSDPAGADPDERNLGIAPPPESLAYVIFTSGSTGVPKGAMIRHAAIAARLAWQVGRLEFGPGFGTDDAALFKAPVSFDISVNEIFLPLVCGARLVVAEPLAERDPARLVELIARHEVTFVYVTSSMLDVWVELPDFARAAAGVLRHVWCGGEVLTPELYARFRRVCAAVMYHGYGPAEATIGVSSEVYAGASAAVTIGRPNPNTRVLVLDAGCRPVPVGVPGELYVGGMPLARGYLDDPTRTAERFVADPFGPPGERLYRTGDLGRYRSDGRIEFLGRADDQVKIRGMRVELGEIEATLARHPAVRQAVVALRGGALVAWCAVSPEVGPVSAQRGYGPAPHSRRLSSGDELRAWAAELLPEHMVPAALMVLDSLPLTPSGKVDRAVLPDPETSGTRDEVAPRPGMEEVAAGVLADVLGLPRIGATDDFFALGGHSLLAGKAAARLRAALGREVGVRDLFEAPTVSGLVARVAGGAQARAALGPMPRPERVPLSPAQRRLWFVQQLEGERATYHVPFALELTGALDTAALRSALDDVVARHESLRTIFPEHDGEPHHLVLPAEQAPVAVPERDLTGAELRGTELTEALAATVARPFTLTTEPPVRAELYRLAPERHVLLLVLHHIAADQGSVRPLLTDLGVAYTARVEGRPPRWVALPVQYADYTLWQREVLGNPDDPGSVLGTELAHWRHALAGLPDTLELPTDRPRPAAADGAGAIVPITVDPDLHRAVRALAGECGVSVFMVLQAVLAGLLHRLGAGDDVPLGSPIAGRPDPALEDAIGFFLNTVVLRTDVSGDPSLRALLSRVRVTDLAAYGHAELPFERLVEELNPHRSLGRHPLFQVMLAHQVSAHRPLDVPGLTSRTLFLPARTAKFDLTVSLIEYPGRDGIEGGINYRTDLFDADTAATIAERFVRLLAVAVADPDRPIGRLEILTEAERRMHAPPALEPGTGLDGSGSEDTLPARVRRKADPDAAAITDGDRRLTHRELAERSDRLAALLRTRGVGREDLVALLLPRGADLVVAMLATLKAGAGYLPLDLAHPPARHRFVLADARPALLLTAGDIELDTGPDAPPRLDLDAPDVRRALDTAPTGSVDHGHPDALAYVIYTSGTTGTPKGVAVTQRNMTRLLDRTDDRFRFDHADTWTLFHSCAFDFSVWEIWGALATGGRLVVVPAEVARAPEEFRRLLAGERVTVLNQTPSAYHQLTEAAPGPTLPSSVRLVIFGGEALDPRRLPALGADGPELVNMYGITETTVHVTYRRVADERTSVVGVPIPDLGVYLLDARLRPVPPGVTGEMYVSGAGLARGYLGRSGLTAGRFVADPFGPPGTRMYRSGDLARHRRDGSLEYRGRADAQVKVRGFRVEPGEIEATLIAHPDVAAAAVALREFTPGDHRLVGYVVPARDTDPDVLGAPDPSVPLGSVAPGTPRASAAVLLGFDAAALRAHLAAALPAHMVPAALVAVPALPLTANGKLDRPALARLPLAAETSTDTDPDGTPEPASERERVLCRLFAEQLGVPRVGPHDGFFELGGHSMLAVRLAGAVRATLGVEVTVRDVFERQTPAALAAGLAPAGPPRPPLRVMSRPERVPLSPAQRRLWTLDQLQHGSPAYHVPLALRLTGELDRAALAAAVADLRDRHEVLRTVLPAAPIDEGGEPHQRVLGADELPSPLTVETVPPGTELAAASAAARRPFDLATDPPLRATLFPVGPREHLLLLCLHHVAADEDSVPALLADLRAGYAARLAGAAPDRAPLPVQYADYALWQLELLGLDDPAGGGADSPDSPLAYWNRTLAGAPEQLELPTDRPRPAVPSHRGGRVTGRWDPELHREVRALAARTGTTVFMVVQAALAALLTRLGAGEDVVLGAPSTGRGDPRLDGLVGYFVNTLALRTDASGNPRFEELLARVRETDLGAFGHADVPFERVVESVNPRRSAGRHPLFGIMLSYREGRDGELELPGLTVRPEPAVTDTAKFDLTVLLAARPDAGVDVLVKYARDLFDGTSVTELLGRLERLLRAAVADPSTRLAALPLLADDERVRIVGDWNATDAPVPATDLVTLLKAGMTRDPSAVAVVSSGDSGEVELTYRELDERTARLARRLRAHGVRAESLVGVCLRRGPDLVVAMVAVLRAGGAFVPLDPAWPARRIADIAAGLSLVLTHPPTADQVPATVPGLDVTESAGRDDDTDDGADDDTHDGADDGADAALPDRVPGDQLAYVIYTSGSTGVPKGAMIRHRAIAARLPWQRDRLGFGPGFGTDDAALFKAPVSFDISVNEIFLPLVCGARLVVAEPGAERDPDRIVELIARHRVTFVYVTSSMLDVWLQTPGFPEAAAVLRHVWCGGEVLTPELYTRFRAACAAVMYHGYGPAEATIGVSSEVYAGASAAVTIGRPNPNTRVLVLDAGCRPVPVGVPGELYVGGMPLARGYLDDPTRTAERFVADPFGAPGERLYRTGDLGRYRSDGRIEFLGRADDQVKIRGMRVELGEIEGVLARHPAVRQAVVALRGGALVAWCAVSPEVGPVSAQRGYGPAAHSRRLSSGDELRAWAAELLPEHMVPAALTVLDELPLTPSGKVDRAALPEPAPPARGPGRAPATERERLLCRLFGELLGHPEVGADQGFFELGGDSIMVIQLVNRARAAGLALAAHDVLDGGTPERIAAAATGATADTVHDDPGGPLPLTPIMHQFRERGGPLRGFTQSMLLRVPAGLGVENLARALDAVLARHDTLRLRVRTDPAGDWRLDIAPPPGVGGPERVRRVDATVAGGPEPEVAGPEGANSDTPTPRRSGPARVGLSGDALAVAVRAAAEHARDRLDPSTGAMVHATWLDRGAEDGRLLLMIHHLAVDGVSWRIVLPDLADAWRAVADGAEPVLAPVPTSFARWSRALTAAAPARRGELERWSSVVATPDPALTDRDLEVTRDVLGTSRSVQLLLEPGRTAPLYGAVPAAFGVGINDILLTALALAVADWRARHRGVSVGDVLIDLEGHGRHESVLDGQAGPRDLSRTVGWFTTVHPVRARLGTDDPAALWSDPSAAARALAAVADSLRAVPDGGLGWGQLRHLDPVGAAALRDAAPPRLGFNYVGRFASGGPTDRTASDTDRTGPSGGDWTDASDGGALLGALDPTTPFEHPLEVNAATTDGPDGPRLAVSWSWPDALWTRDQVEDLAHTWFRALDLLATAATASTVPDQPVPDQPAPEQAVPEPEEGPCPPPPHRA